MNKNTVLGVGALLIILATVVLYAATKPLPAKAPGESASGVALPASGYVEHADYYDITANYASSTPLQGEKNTAAIALMQKFVSDTITQFKTENFANLTAEDIKMLGFSDDHKEALNIVYLVASSPRTVSYIFTTYANTFGAHPNTYFHTFTFDTTTGASLSLADVFTGNSYLNALSSIARAKLPEAIGKDLVNKSMMDDGTTSKEENFSNFFFDNKDFIILFDPYQVAAYAAGPQTLRIPLSELANILKPEYR